MQIIDKNKDYYDYCQFEFGPVDKTSTYDRRGSKILTEDEFFWYCYERGRERLHNSNYYKNWSHRYGEDKVLLEIGNVQYILQLKNHEFKWINQKADEFTIRGDVAILHRFDNGIHLCQSPVTLTHFHHKKRYSRDWYRELESALDIVADRKEVYIENPILKNTPIPSIIPAREFYNALDNYFRAMYNDKTIEIVNSDIDKAEMHGFDKKTSFRHPVVFQQVRADGP